MFEEAAGWIQLVNAGAITLLAYGFWKGQIIPASVHDRVVELLQKQLNGKFDVLIRTQVNILNELRHTRGLKPLTQKDIEKEIENGSG